jgi:Fe2+ or Zn2+ uptake regulation protein
MHADILTIIDRAGGTASARDIYRSIQQSNPEMRKDKVLSALSYMANPKRANSIERVRKGLFKLKVR